MGLALSVVAQLVAVVGLALALLSLARQVSILHQRLAPAGEGLSAPKLLSPGEALEPTSLTTLDGHVEPLAASDPYERTLLLFVSPDCPLCRSLMPVFLRFSEPAGRALIAADDPDVSGFASYLDTLGVEPGSAVMAAELGRRLGVRELPALCGFGADNRLILNKVVHTPAELERELAQLASPSGENAT